MKDKASKEDFDKDYFDFLLNNDDALNEITELLLEKIFCKYNIDFYAYEIFKSLLKRKMLKVLNKHKNLLVNSDSFIDLMVENLEKDVTNLRIKIIEDLYLY